MNSLSVNSKIKLRRNQRGNLAEFGPALILFFALILVPVLAIIRFGVATTAVYIVVGKAADSAAKAPTYDLALSRANKVAGDLINLPIWGISGLRTGALKRLRLYVDEQVVASGKSNVFGPDEPLRKSICPYVNLYQYDVRASCTFEPLMPVAGMPVLGKIPLLTAPATLNVRAVRAVEYPSGLIATNQ